MRAVKKIIFLFSVISSLLLGCGHDRYALRSGDLPGQLVDRGASTYKLHSSRPEVAILIAPSLLFHADHQGESKLMLTLGNQSDESIEISAGLVEVVQDAQGLSAASTSIRALSFQEVMQRKRQELEAQQKAKALVTGMNLDPEAYLSLGSPRAMANMRMMRDRIEANIERISALISMYQEHYLRHKVLEPGQQVAGIVEFVDTSAGTRSPADRSFLLETAGEAQRLSVQLLPQSAF